MGFFVFFYLFTIFGMYLYYHPHIPRIFCVLWNCLRGLFKSVGDQYISCELSGILDQCISNKVNDAVKNKSKSQINLTDVCRLEKNDGYGKNCVFCNAVGRARATDCGNDG